MDPKGGLCLKASSGASPPHWNL
ncbi:hypothetical protein [Pseudomonas extremaustralis]